MGRRPQPDFFDQNDAEESKFRIKIVQKRRISQFFAQKRRETAPTVPKTSKSRFWQLVESIPLSVISQNSAKKLFPAVFDANFGFSGV